MKSKKVRFVPPNGTVPEGTQAGDEFDLVTTYRMDEDGQCCMVRMGDTQMDYDKHEKSKPDYHDMANNIMSDRMTMSKDGGDQ